MVRVRVYFRTANKFHSSFYFYFLFCSRSQFHFSFTSSFRELILFFLVLLPVLNHENITVHTFRPETQLETVVKPTPSE